MYFVGYRFTSQSHILGRSASAAGAAVWFHTTQPKSVGLSIKAWRTRISFAHFVCFLVIFEEESSRPEIASIPKSSSNQSDSMFNGFSPVPLLMPRDAQRNRPDGGEAFATNLCMGNGHRFASLAGRVGVVFFGKSIEDVTFVIPTSLSRLDVDWITPVRVERILWLDDDSTHAARTSTPWATTNVVAIVAEARTRSASESLRRDFLAPKDRK